MRKVYFSYKHYGIAVDQLSNKILKEPTSKFIESIYGIPRGGLPIAIHLSHSLKIPYHHIDLNFFDTKQNIVLLVDDISDTGNSLLKYFNALKSMNDHLTILTACLHTKKETKLIPDFYVEEIEMDDWIVYPWEKHDEETKADYLKPVVHK